MNIKKIINFTTLRSQGPSALNIKHDEVIQLQNKKEMLCIVTQEYLLELLKNQASSSLFSSNQLMGSVSTQLFGPNNSQFEDLRPKGMKLMTNDKDFIKLKKAVENLTMEVNKIKEKQDDDK